MKQFMAQVGICAMLALAACGGGEEEPKPMELGPDTAKSEAATPIDIASDDIRGVAPELRARLRPGLCIAAHSG